MHPRSNLRCTTFFASRAYASLLAISVCLAAGQSSQHGTQAVLKIFGNVTTPLTLTLDDLKKLPHRDATVKEHEGSTAVYQGVPLLTLLTRAGAPVGPQLKGKALASYVLASARDGYQVTFALAELDPAIRDSTVLVADQREGQALGEQLGPIRIIAVTDKKPARSIRMLTSLEVVVLRP